MASARRSRWKALRAASCTTSSIAASAISPETWPLPSDPSSETLRPDAVYAIPLHRRRRRSRGFNQSEIILRRLAMPPAPGRLERIHATASQVGLDVRARRRNVAGAFRYRGPDLAGATVAVLDDVVTTGATAHECARVLREHGAGRVYALAYARASFAATAPPCD